MSKERQILREWLYVTGEFTDEAAERTEQLIVQTKELLNSSKQETYDMSIHSSTDAREWTDFFFETHPTCNVNKETMFGWFANAMTAMHDDVSRNLIREHLDDIEDLKALIGALKQKLAEQRSHRGLEQQCRKNITAKQKIESFRSGYFRAVQDLKRKPLNDETHGIGVNNES